MKSLSECPHMSQIGWRNRSQAMFHCGGSLIGEFFVISAAHCRYVGAEISNVVRLGASDDHDVKRFLVHPQYSSYTKHQDIALVEITEPFKYIE